MSLRSSQWHWGFAPPFPLNVVLLPFTLFEWFIRWSVAVPGIG